MNITNKIKIIQDHCSRIQTMIPPKKIKFVTRMWPIRFHKKDTLITASEYTSPLILILADETRPGGTWISGMQEETLFRRTELFAHLKKEMYPIKDDELILARGVGVFSLYEDFDIPTVNWRADFIACPGLKNYDGTPDETVILKNKIRLIFDTAIEYKYSNIILGALGTGAFGCDSKAVARCFIEVITEYSPSIFSNIVFAITGKTFDIWKDMFDAKFN